MQEDVVVISHRKRFRTKLLDLLEFEPSFFPRWPWEPEPPALSQSRQPSIAIVDVVALCPCPDEALAVPLWDRSLDVLVIGYLLEDGDALLAASTHGVPFHYLEGLTSRILATLLEPGGLAASSIRALRSVCGNRVRQFLGQDDRISKLVGRDAQIVSLLSMGYDNPKIAETLGIAPKTVRNHLSRVYEILGVSGRAEAVALCLRKTGSAPG